MHPRQQSATSRVRISACGNRTRVTISTGDATISGRRVCTSAPVQRTIILWESETMVRILMTRLCSCFALVSVHWEIVRRQQGKKIICKIFFVICMNVHTLELISGHYLYTEASGQRVNDTARIISPLYNSSLTDSGCFSFWWVRVQTTWYVFLRSADCACSFIFYTLFISE